MVSLQAVASSPTDRTIVVALDFDGTMTVDDVGDTLFQRFGSFEPIHTELLEGRMTVAEYYRRSVDMLTQELTPDRLQSFSATCEIDHGLPDLVAFCTQQRMEVIVVSDGFDAYIMPILHDNALSDLTVHCNQLTFTNGRWHPHFPGASESCSCYCASCKRNAVLSHIDEKDILIYIGDGLSDTCAARHADIIFAKGKLAAWCNEERLPHHTFKTLHDVRRVLAQRVAIDDIRQRRQAVLARASAFTSE